MKQTAGPSGGGGGNMYSMSGSSSTALEQLAPTDV